MVRNDRIPEAIEIFRRWVKDSPRSPWAFDALAYALEKDDQLEEARA